MQEFFEKWATECLRVLKHGGFLLAFGGTRTYHRLACGIEDAGFEIRDCIQWIYGSGFPKSLNIGKQIDKMNGRTGDYPELREYLKKKRAEKKLTIKQVAEKLGVYQALYGFYEQKNTCSQIPSKRLWNKLKEILDLDDRFDELIARIEAEREVIGRNHYTNPKELYQVGKEKEGIREDSLITAPNLQEAKQWEGWGTALKPACEPIVVARKPLSEKTVALNVLKHGTGGINVDACRIEVNPEIDDMLRKVDRKKRETQTWETGSGFKNENNSLTGVRPDDRFPANLILDEEAGKMLDEQSGISKSIARPPRECKNPQGVTFMIDKPTGQEHTDKGGASRFFYCAKASKSERNYGCEGLEEKQKIYRATSNGTGEVSKNMERFASIMKNNHPTVKPIKLMEYLVKLVSKEGATVLDPFMGSGTTLIACTKLGRKGIGIEKEPEYIKIAKARIKPYLEQTKLNTS